MATCRWSEDENGNWWTACNHGDDATEDLEAGAANQAREREIENRIEEELNHDRT